MSLIVTGYIVSRGLLGVMRHVRPWLGCTRSLQSLMVDSVAELLT